MKPYLIGIAGPSGAGKSYLAEHLGRELPESTILPVDAYYPDLGHLTEEQRSRQNFDDPAVLDSALLIGQVSSLAQGTAVAQPVYDFAHHTRTSQTREVLPPKFLIVEGIFTFYYPELRELLHTRVYVDTNAEVSLERRIARDVAERGRTRESVEQQFRQSVLPMAERFVRPTARFAHMIVTSDQSIGEEVASVLAHIRSRA